MLFIRKALIEKNPSNARTGAPISNFESHLALIISGIRFSSIPKIVLYLRYPAYMLLTLSTHPRAASTFYAFVYPRVRSPTNFFHLFFFPIYHTPIPSMSHSSISIYARYIDPYGILGWGKRKSFKITKIIHLLFPDLIFFYLVMHVFLYE